MGFFDDIPIRENGGTVDAGWWNIIRTKLIASYGNSLTGDTQQTITDGQAATDITGLLLSSASTSTVEIHITSKRDDGTNQRRHKQHITAWYNSRKAAWAISVEELGKICTASVCTSGGSGITYSITSGGQMQAAANTMGGSHVGTIMWKIVQSNGVEA